MKKKQILTPEQKAKIKIYMAEYHLKNKAKHKIKKAKWYKENKEEQNRQMQEWNKENPNYKKEWDKANPGYAKECNHKHDLGFWIVYVITNYNGLGDNYCGQTMNIYMRMATHKSLGKLNTDTYTIVKECDTLEDALEIESAVHNFGYHGYNNGK